MLACNVLQEGIMELSSELVSLQTVIKECEKHCGNLENLSYNTGSEASVQYVYDAIKLFLAQNNYVADPLDTATVNDEALEKIVLCLICNTKLGNDSIIANLPNYSHLLDLMPKLSRFLLLSTMIKLQLVKHLLNATQNLPLELLPDLFENVNDVITGADGEKVLWNIEIMISYFIQRLNVIDVQENMLPATVEKIDQIADQLLKNLHVHPSINMADSPGSVQYLHVGYILKSVLKMLQMVNKNNPACSSIIQLLFMTVPVVLKHVTIQIFCAWAEVQEEDVSLQYSIGINAYEVIEKYSDVEITPGIMSSLSCMARKPPSLVERISYASSTTIISKVNLGDENQIEWFKAFLRTPIFNNDLSRQCLEKWSVLCDINDALHVLEEAMDLDDDTKHLAIKCVSHLSTDDLAIMIAKLFASNGPWSGYISKSTAKQDLRVLLKKLNQSEGCSYTELAKELLLLLIESPKEVMGSLYQECFEHFHYVSGLQEFFMAIKNLMGMKLTALEVLKATLDNADCFADSYDAKGIFTLLKALLEWECVEIDKLFTYVLRPLISGFDAETDSLYVTLRIIRDLNINSMSELQKETLAFDVLNILERHRIMYTSYSSECIEVCIAAIGILKKLCTSFEDFPSLMANESVSKLNRYYLTLKKEYSMPSLLMYLFPDFEPKNYGQILDQLIKFLSRCIPVEWLQITEDLVLNLGTLKSLYALTDCLLLICEVIQPLARRNDSVYKSLSFYLRNYRICIEKLAEKDASIEFGVEIVKNICRLLKMLPKRVKHKEGMRLIKQFNSDALKALANDKQFVSSLPEIDDVNLTQIIAEQMVK